MELKVGSKYEYALMHPEGCQLQIGESGILLWLNYISPTKEEISHWTRPGKTEFRAVNKNGIFFLLAKAEGENWIDIPYCPQISDTYRLLEPIYDDTSGYAMQIMLTDKSSGEIKGLRLIGLGNAFSKEIKYMLDSLIDITPFLTAPEFYSKLSMVYSTYSTSQLVEFSHSSRFLTRS